MVLAWKQNVAMENLDANKAKSLLKNFAYETSVDDKEHLVISDGPSIIRIGFKPNGETTTVGVVGSIMKPWAFLLFLIFIFCCVLPGFLLSIYLSSKSKKIYLQAVQELKSNISTTMSSSSSSSASNDVMEKISKLNALKDQGLISDEEFNKKKSEIIANM